LPFFFHNIIKGIGRRPLDRESRKSLHGCLLPYGNIKAIQRRMFPVNLFNVGDSQLRYINLSDEGEGVTTAEKDQMLTPPTAAQAKTQERLNCK
jgi:hypothetical protein